MSILDENVQEAIKQIESIHDLANRTNWGDLKRDGFVFELERCVKRLRDLYELILIINKETLSLLEKNTPNIDSFLELFNRE
jgi:hypothetical protein